ncbi:MAG: hypothetical protein K6G69_01980 [Lachnospiraceae bacterium]|nr:hypothetical protein [Lachnospiraceae bacterium]
MKKLVALLMVGVMTFGMAISAVAANSPSASAVVATTQTNDATSIYAGSAAELNMTVPEYRNNVITSVPGLEGEALMVTGQGGHVEINGAPSNYTVTLIKPNKADTDAAKDQAKKAKGKIVSFFGLKGFNFNTAKINFWVSGMQSGKKIEAYQLNNGVWTKVVVNEVRKDHVVVTLTKNAEKLLFVEV